MNYFFLFLSAGLGTATSLISRIVKKGSNGLAVASASNVATFFVAFLTIFFFGLFKEGQGFFSSLQAVPILLAVLYGVSMMTAQFLMKITTILMLF